MSRTSFFYECKHKYSASLRADFSNVLNIMPLAAIINGLMLGSSDIFWVSSGLSKEFLSLKDIRKIEELSIMLLNQLFPQTYNLNSINNISTWYIILKINEIDSQDFEYNDISRDMILNVYDDSITGWEKESIFQSPLKFGSDIATQFLQTHNFSAMVSCQFNSEESINESEKAGNVTEANSLNKFNRLKAPLLMIYSKISKKHVGVILKISNRSEPESINL